MRKTLIALVLLVGLALAADRVAAYLAARQIESRVRADTGQEVTASVGGFPFLTQVAGRSLDAVRLVSGSATLPGEDVKVVDLTADLSDVSITGEPRAGRLDVRGVVPFAEIERRHELPAASLSAGSDGQVRSTQRVEVLGQPLDVVGIAAVRLDGDALLVEPVELEPEGSTVGLDPALEARLRERLGFSISLADVPEGTRVESVQVVAGGLAVRLVGRDVRLADL